MNESPNSRPNGKIFANWLKLSRALLGALFIAVTHGAAQVIQYWDLNGATAGSGTSPSGTWSTGVAAWSASAAGTSGTIAAWTNGNTANFAAGSDAFAGTFTVTVSGTVQVSGMMIEDGASTFTGGTINFSDATPDFIVNPGLTTTVNSVISGTNGLTKNGTGTLALGGTNTYTGTTTVTAGTLRISADHNLSASNGGLTLNGGTLNTTSTFTLNATRVFSTGTGGSLDVAAGTTFTYNGILAGAGTLDKNGTGTFITGGATDNSFSGDLNINAGVFEVAKTANIGGIGNDADVTVAAGATLRFNGGVAKVLDTVGSIAGAGTITNTGAADLTLALKNSVNTTFSGTLTDGTNDLILTKNGTGTLTLSGANSYDGATNVNVGAINIQSNTALGTTAAGTIVASGAALEIQNNITVAGEALTLSGTGVGGNGALRNISGANTWTGNVTLAAASQIQSDAGTLTVSGNVSSTNLALTLDGAGSTNLSGVVGLGSGGLTKTGTGTATLSGANTYTGATTVSGGALNIQHNTALGTAAAGTTVTTGAALEVQGNIAVTGEALTLSGTGVGGNGALRNISGTNTWTGAVTLAAASQIQSDAGTLTVSGNVSSTNLALTLDGAGNTNLSGGVGLGSGGLTKTGTGTVTLSGGSANTYSGATTITNGTLNLGKTAGVNAVGPGAITVGDSIGAAGSANLVLLASNQMANTAALTLNSDGRLALNNFSQSINTLAGTGLVDLSTSGYLVVGANNGSSVFGGSITGTGTLEKAGTGSLTFNSAINYAGALTLSGGTLLLNGISATIGTLNITGNSIIDFAGTASTLNLASLNISAGFTLTITNWANATDYFLAGNWSGATFSTTGSAPMNQVVFTGFTGNDTKWQSYDNQITPVPEPATYGAMLLGALLSLSFWRRRRSGSRQVPARK